MTHNNWISTTLDLVPYNYYRDFQIFVAPHEYKKLSFTNATYYTCELIASRYSNLYVAFSGGLDSEYIVRAFHRLQVPFIPVIVPFSNEKESSYALSVCKELNLNPVVIDTDEEKFFKCFLEQVLLKYNSPAYNVTQQILALEYTNSVGGTLILGNNMILDGDSIITNNKYLDTNEWDFYATHCSEPDTAVNFFVYTPEIAYSIMPDTEGISWNSYKSRLYSVSYRKKLKPVYSAGLQQKLRSALDKHYSPRNLNETWTKNKFNSIFL
jgi:hypothetical protein